MGGGTVMAGPAVVVVTWPKLVSVSKQIKCINTTFMSDEPISPKALFVKENCLHLPFFCAWIFFSTLLP